MSILSEINDCLPSGWDLHNLIKLGPNEWQANIADDEHVATGTGTSIEQALDEATRKVFDHVYVGRFFALGHTFHEPRAESGLLASLGLARPAPQLTRRSLR